MGDVGDRQEYGAFEGNRKAPRYSEPGPGRGAPGRIKGRRSLSLPCHWAFRRPARCRDQGVGLERRGSCRGVYPCWGENLKDACAPAVPILENLRAWLQPIAKLSGPVVERELRYRHEAARERAGIKEWPENCMRHSFVSYRLAATQNAPQTALESGHDQAVLFKHYPVTA